MANLEQAILDGSFHQGADVDAEPVRPASPSLSAGGHSDDEDGGGSGGAKLQRQDLGPSLLAPEEADARYSSVWSRPASHSTGPKGVLADFRASSYEDPQLPGALEKVALGEDRRDGDEIRADSGVEAWRKKRLEELKGSRIGHGLDEDAEARFGRFREIGVNSFESAVLDEDPSVKVVLHVFEPRIPACQVLNQHLSNIARVYPETKFLRAKASELDFATEDADVVLPTLLVYQGGSLIGNLVAVDLEWGRVLDYDQDQVEEVLLKNGAIASQKQEE